MFPLDFVVAACCAVNTELQDVFESMDKLSSWILEVQHLPPKSVKLL